MTVETSQISVSLRGEALEAVKLVATNAPVSELAPYLRGLMTHDHEQAFAIMRGSGNEMSPSLQLLMMLAYREFITMDEVFAAEEARLEAATGQVA